MYLQVTEPVDKISSQTSPKTRISSNNSMRSSLGYTSKTSMRRNLATEPTRPGNHCVAWPIQFAFVGMNAHINHDLPLAVVVTCKKLGKDLDSPPAHVRVADTPNNYRLTRNAQSGIREKLV